MAMGIVGLALIGMSGIFLGSYYYFLPKTGVLPESTLHTILEIITGFALGAETTALFARVAGGIYTKAADVGADIVGKIEASIPEDDPRNPATIADNVGDNVGDVAGMGADLFGSYVSTMLAAMVLGTYAYVPTNTETMLPVVLPMYIGGLGTFFSLLAIVMVRLPNEKSNVQATLNIGNLLAVLATAIASNLLIHYLLPNSVAILGHTFTANQLWYTLLIGMAIGLAISFITEYFTTKGYAPVDSIIAQSATGPATNLIAGLKVGMLSTLLPVLLFGISICISFSLAGFYGVAMAAVGMMSTTAMQLAIDAFGPIADNAGGIAEMSGLPSLVRKRTDILDTVGNTTAATGKGFAIASAALTSVGLFAAYAHTAQLSSINLCKAPVLASLFVGAMIPMLFSALTIGAVGNTALKIVQEVRRQFKEITGLLEGKTSPEYERCIEIASLAALQHMWLPGALALLAPILVGICFGAEVLGAYVAGVTASGIVMALFQCNAGGAWDNAKKALEQGVEINGQQVGKGSLPHQAAVVGDTVGDPLKDTSGPAMNILIKLTAIVALTIVPYL